MSTATIVTIVAPISVSMVLFIVGCCFLTRRGKKKNNIVEEESGKE